jgi:CubicO group peptidase (beta-lactamase class C family)
MEDRRIPGLQVAVVVNGKTVLSRSYGVANLQTPVPVTATTLFTLNSITKAFTGIAAMREVEKGSLDLSAPISRYLDDIPASWGRVTVRQSPARSSRSAQWPHNVSIPATAAVHAGVRSKLRLPLPKKE